MIGAQVLNYRIDSKIGEGGMGSVYLASHLQMRRKAAIKALHPNLVNNTQIRERFRNEAEAMASLKHPNIIDLYDFLETNQGLFLIMEFIEGKPLDDYVRTVTGPLPEDRAIALFTKALDGFAYAHDRGIIHRDIKPSNLMIGNENQIKILDFGIAKILNDVNKGLTRTGSKMGTVLYMSPEQVKGLSADRRSDIYSLGVTLFQILTGRPPYDEKTSTEYDVYTKIVNSPLPRLRKFNPGVSERMQAIIDKATAKEPQERYQTALEFKQALQSLIQHQAGATLTTTVPTGGGVNPQRQTPPNKPRTQNRKPAPKKTAPDNNIWLPLSVVVLLGVLTYLVLWNPLNIKPLQKIAVFSHAYKKRNASTKQDKKETVKITLRKFYDAAESRNFDNIRPFYRKTIANYFGNKNIDRERDLRSAYKYSWDKIVTEERHKIDWDSMQYSEDEEGNHTAIFDYTYEYQPKKAKKPEDQGKTKSVSRKAEVRMDKEYRVYYVKNVKK
ncbi:serine/threonine-protein kinase [uncultured Microscilla sp.]|uniref:serine/threonine protein kinase n=1 Tax=uncultured Microscilla sp. TaxID=432653 RepID=UPI00263793CF|nr:serine/threonine-protein kinase [uncultured Microscilla sp.]